MSVTNYMNKKRVFTVTTQRTQAERLAVIENELKLFKETQREHNTQQAADIKEIKMLLKEHIDWEADKYDNLKDEFAAKWTEKIIYGMVGLILIAFITALIRMVFKGGLT